MQAVVFFRQSDAPHAGILNCESCTEFRYEKIFLTNQTILTGHKRRRWINLRLFHILLLGIRLPTPQKNAVTSGSG
jgi:hypothetical protein